MPLFLKVASFFQMVWQSSVDCPSTITYWTAAARDTNNNVWASPTVACLPQLHLFANFCCQGAFISRCVVFLPDQLSSESSRIFSIALYSANHQCYLHSARDLCVINTMLSGLCSFLSFSCGNQRPPDVPKFCWALIFNNSAYCSLLCL